MTKWTVDIVLCGKPNHWWLETITVETDFDHDVEDKALEKIQSMLDERYSVAHIFVDDYKRVEA